MRVSLFRRINLLTYGLTSNLRVRIYRAFGMTIGENSSIGMEHKVDDPRKVVIGKNCKINRGVCMYSGIGDASIIIGDNVNIGMDTKFVCPTHEIGDSQRRRGDTKYKTIKVGSGCWLGANVTVLPGVTIGEGCIIAAGAVVAKDCKPNCLYGGVPAKIIRELPV